MPALVLRDIPGFLQPTTKISPNKPHTQLMSTSYIQIHFQVTTDTLIQKHLICPTYQHPIHNNTEEPVLKISLQAKIFNLLRGLCTAMCIIQRDTSYQLLTSTDPFKRFVSVASNMASSCYKYGSYTGTTKIWKKNVLIRLESAITLNNF